MKSSFPADGPTHAPGAVQRPVGPDPAAEPDRLAALHRYHILDTPSEPEFDDFTALATLICGTPIALISLVDSDRQWFKSKIGIGASQTPREIAFCDHAIRGVGVMEVPDAIADERFRDNPLVRGAPDIRFYAGAPLTTKEGFNLGTLCVIDRVPRRLTAEQRDGLERLARGVLRQMELRRATQSLAERSAFNEAMLQSAASAIISTTTEGIITSFNPAAEELLGYPASALVGSQTPATFHDPAEVAARALALSAELQRPVAPGFEVFVAHAQEGRAETREWTYVRRDGTRIPVLLSVSALRDGSGITTGYLGVARDLSERKRADEMHARLAAIVEGSDDAIASKTLDGVVTSWNAAAERLLQYPAAEIIGQPVARLIPPGRLQEESLILGRIRQGGTVEHFETQRCRKDGTLVDVSVAISPIKNASGGIVGASKIIRDVTARKQAEASIAALNDHLRERTAQLEAANRELTDFAYVVSHDLKAPLRGIATLANWLLTDSHEKLDETGREHLALLQARVRRLDGLINGILAYSRAGRTRAEPARVELGPLVANVIQLLDPPRHIAIEIMPELPAVLMEPIKAQQVFQNLLSNAIKFMDKPAGIIRVRCDLEADAWHFQVADNGPGIAPKYFEQIFQLFQTLSPRDEVESTGVGLAIVKKIIESGGGRVWVESGPDHGATFHFTLPLRPPGSVQAVSA